MSWVAETETEEGGRVCESMAESRLKRIPNLISDPVSRSARVLPGDRTNSLRDLSAMPLWGTWFACIYKLLKLLS